MLSRNIRELAPLVYASVHEKVGIPTVTDMSHSNRCDLLTHEMQQALTSLGFTVCRELHQTSSGLWHVVLRHRHPDVALGETDMITDLNPWQFTQNNRYSGYLHGARDDIIKTLVHSGAPESVVSLRSITTVTRLNVTETNPFAKY